jgi:hypothetical protein
MKTCKQVTEKYFFESAPRQSSLVSAHTGGEAAGNSRRRKVKGRQLQLLSSEEFLVVTEMRARGGRVARIN